MRCLTLVVLVVATVVAPTAQTTFGVRAGVSVLGQSFESDFIYESDDALSKQARLGIAVGVFADVPLSAVVSLRPGLSYVQKGYRVVLDEPELFAGSSTLGADYLEAPLLLALRVPGTSPLALSVEAGPTLGYRVRTVERCEGGLVPSCEAFPYGDDLKDVEVGGVVGLVVGSGPFGVETRYSRSLRRADDPAVELGLSDVRYEGLTVAARYAFRR